MDTQLSRLQQLDILINAIDERLTTAETTEGQTKMGSDFISDAHAKVDEERDAISLAQERGEESDIEMHDLEDSGYTTAVEEIPGPSATGDAETSSMPGESSLDAPLINAATIWGKRNLAREYLKRGHKRLKFAQIMAHIGVKPDEQQWRELYFLIDPK